jgi:hypothetical protein
MNVTAPVEVQNCMATVISHGATIAKCLRRRDLSMAR